MMCDSGCTGKSAAGRTAGDDGPPQSITCMMNLNDVCKGGESGQIMLQIGARYDVNSHLFPGLSGLCSEQWEHG